jgi:hypothetical protein
MARPKTTARPRGAARPTAAAVSAAAQAARFVVYVHGICHHDPGYSDGWFAAMKPFVPSIPDGNRREVLWSDAVGATPAVMGLHTVEGLAAGLQATRVPLDPQLFALAADVRDVLIDRLQHLYVQVATRAATDLAAAGGQTPAHAFLTAVPGGPLALVSVPGFECVSDFASYLLDPATREAVLKTFDDVVRPLLQEGNQLEIISHSWGTVVAYEALRRMDGDSGLPAGAVLNFFTVGAALSLAPVRRRLLPEAGDGARPRVAANWVNLNAHFDVVGGPLRGNPFAVDAEFLNLPAVGCPAHFPDPRCSHASYFRPENLLVNRDVFGRIIEG